jgi:DNA-directed RNA polymerase sigma subunit (sigma70/sigma32)
VLGDLVAPDNHDWVADVEQGMIDDRLMMAVEQLDQLQRDVLTRRFGLDGSTPTSLQATADALGVGVRRVRRAEMEGLAALQSDGAVISIHEEV